MLTDLLEGHRKAYFEALKKKKKDDEEEDLKQKVIILYLLKLED